MIRHAAFTLASRVSSILALLICTPFYYRALGPEGYALIAISLIAHSLSGLIDAGLSPLAAAALARSANGDDARTAILSEVFLRSGRRIVPLWLASVAGMLVYSSLSDHGQELGRFATLGTSAILFADVFLLVLFRIAYACLQGFRKHGAANLIYTITLGLRAILGVGAVLMFRSPQSVFAGQALGSLLGILMALLILEFAPARAWQVVSRPWRRGPTEMASIDAAALRHLWAISFFASVSSVVPQLVVKLFGTPTDLTHFSLAGSIANALLAFQTAYQAVLLPEFARTMTARPQDDPDAVASRAMAGTFIIASICGIGYVSAPSLLALWLGDFNLQHLGSITTLMRWQLISVAFLAATAVPYVLCIVRGRTKPQLYTSVVYFALITSGTMLGYRLAGTRGVAIGTACATAIFSILYVFAAQTSPMKARLMRLVRWAVLPLLVGALPAVLVLLSSPGDAPTSYRDALLTLVVQGTLGMAISLGIAIAAYRVRAKLWGTRGQVASPTAV